MSEYQYFALAALVRSFVIRSSVATAVARPTLAEPIFATSSMAYLATSPACEKLCWDSVKVWRSGVILSDLSLCKMVHA